MQSSQRLILRVLAHRVSRAPVHAFFPPTAFWESRRSCNLPHSLVWWSLGVVTLQQAVAQALLVFPTPSSLRLRKLQPYNVTIEIGLQTNTRLANAQFVSLIQTLIMKNSIPAPVAMLTITTSPRRGAFNPVHLRYDFWGSTQRPSRDDDLLAPFAESIEHFRAVSRRTYVR